MHPQSSCKVGGCTRKVKARGWCAGHYDRWRAGANPENYQLRIPAGTRPPFCTVEGCTRKTSARGMCHAHYKRWETYGSAADLQAPITPQGLSIEDRLWPMVEKTSTCWLWRGPISSTGYGALTVRGRGTVSTHRLSWEIHRGPVPEGLELDHLCRVRACCNPEHLEPVTRRENLLRGESPVARAYRERQARRAESS